MEIGDFTHDWLLKWAVGHDGDLRMPSLSSTELWILNKSMASDLSPEPLANEKHFWEISSPLTPVLPSVSHPTAPSPPLCYQIWFSQYLSPFALHPLRTHMHTSHVFSKWPLIVFCFLFFFQRGGIYSAIVWDKDGLTVSKQSTQIRHPVKDLGSRQKAAGGSLQSGKTTQM